MMLRAVEQVLYQTLLRDGSHVLVQLVSTAESPSVSHFTEEEVEARDEWLGHRLIGGA